MTRSGLPEHRPRVDLNLNVRGLHPSATLAISERSAAMIASGTDVFRMGLGQSPFPVPRPVVESLRENAHQKDYLAVKGLRTLRDAIAAYHRRGHGIERTGNDVLIGPGSKELMFLLQLVYYGDLVIPTPSWVSYAPQAQIIGRHVRWLPTRPENNWQLKADEVARLCAVDPERPRLLILNYPNNPTGHTYSGADLEELAEVAYRYRIVLLSDEIYGEIHHEGRHRSIAEYYPEGTIISTGLSKWCGAGGWRLGCFTFPESLGWLLDAMSVVASETYTSTSAPIQYAAVRAFEGGEEIEAYLRVVRRILRALGRHSARKLSDVGIHVAPPEGAFYLFLDFGPALGNRQGIVGSTTLAETLLADTGVAMLPGSHFGRVESELTLRLAYVDFDGAAAMEAAVATSEDDELDEPFLRAHCGHVLTAIDRICDWVTARR